MFLLILDEYELICGALSVFTFHNVSINTLTVVQNLSDAISFTSHNVSINTYYLLEPAAPYNTLHSTMFLLIPAVYSSLQYRYNLTTFCQSCHFIIFILIFIFLDSSHFWNFPDISGIVDLLEFLLYLTSTIII